MHKHARHAGEVSSFMMPLHRGILSARLGDSFPAAIHLLQVSTWVPACLRDVCKLNIPECWDPEGEKTWACGLQYLQSFVCLTNGLAIGLLSPVMTVSAKVSLPLLVKQVQSPTYVKDPLL